MAVLRKKTAAKKAVKKTVAKKAKLKEEKTKVSSSKAATRKPAAKKALAKKAALAKAGFAEKMLEAAVKVLDEKQAQQIVVVPLVGRSSLADYMIIASGRAGRQIVALADHLREAFFKLGVRDVRIEGQNDANWVLVDAGDIIVHLFLPEVRHYYDLDTLWSKKASKR